MSKNLYLCANCRCQIPSVDKALYVDQSTNRPFCSEKCIMAFHSPYMESFEREELAMREELGLGSETELDELYHRHDLFQLALNGAEEVWKEQNPLGEEYYTHISRLDADGKEVYYILVCSYFDNAPSFVFFKCITQSFLLAEFFKGGALLNINSGVDSAGSEPQDTKFSGALTPSDDSPGESDTRPEVEIPQEALEDLELKKSEYLAGLLENRAEEDIPFEDFTRYDEFMQPTIEEPDEIYASEDENGDQTRTYIKSFKANGQAFYYVVVCMQIPIKIPEDHEALLPVIGFPSVDRELYKDYAVGERISEMVKN